MPNAKPAPYQPQSANAQIAAIAKRVAAEVATEHWCQAANTVHSLHNLQAQVEAIAQAIAAQIAIETGDTHWSRGENTMRAQYTLKAVFIGKVAAAIAAQVDALLPAIVKQIAERQPE